jgi:hypothetical protein
MRKKREDRYQSARDMRVDLRVVLGSTDPLAHAATAQFAPPSPVASAAHASTALAIDSGQVAAATASKLTPAGTVTGATPLETPSRSRTLLAALVALAIAAGGVVAWRLYARPSSAPLAAGESLHPASSAPQTTLEPLRAQTGDLPPLEPTLLASASARPAAIPGALGPGKTAATGLAATTTAPAASPAAPGAVPSVTAAPPPAVTTATPTVTATVASTAPPAPAPQAAPPFDPSHARVDWSVAGAGGGATPGAVQRAVARAAGGWTQCYRSALARRNERIDGGGVLHLTTDESGNVVGATIRGLDSLPAVKSCITGSAHVHIDGVDTGDSWADIQLTLRPE